MEFYIQISTKLSETIVIMLIKQVYFLTKIRIIIGYMMLALHPDIAVLRMKIIFAMKS